MKTKYSIISIKCDGAAREIKRFVDAVKSLDAIGRAHIEFNKKLSDKQPIKNDWYRKFDKRKFK